MAQNIEPAKNCFQQWHFAGFTSELLPIVPPDGTIAKASSIRPAHLGKVPGVKKADGTWVGLTGQWSKDLEATEADCRKWWLWGANVGLQTRLFPAIDIDVEDAALAEDFKRLAIERFGPAPVRFREGSARRLLLYRLPAGHKPIRKIRLALGKDGRKHAIEILGHGQQCVVAGRHSSGAEIEWRGSPFNKLHALGELPIEELPRA